MSNKSLKLSALATLLICSTGALALPFNSFDPRSMSMGGTGVAVGDPSTAPFFNPAMLTASDPSKKFSIEFINIGGRLYDPSNMHTGLSNLADDTNALSAAVTNLNYSSNTLATDNTALTASMAKIATPSAGNIATLPNDMKTLQTNLSNVSTDMTNVNTNSQAVSANMNKVNQILLSINNQPLQGEFGASTVLGIPGKTWGFAVYADAWAAMGGELVYNDFNTVKNVSTTVSNVGTSFGNSATAINTAQTNLTTTINALNTANTICTANGTGSLACGAALVTAGNTVGTPTGTGSLAALNTAATTVQTNATSAQTQANSLNTNNTKVQSQIHIRGVLVDEVGLSVSHGFVTSDHTWSLGFTPKIMNLQLYDALLSANNGTSTSGVTGNDFLAKYNTVNFDMGVAKSYNNGWRTGVVVKNVIPQSFDFKQVPQAQWGTGATPVSDGSTLSMNPQARLGISHDNAWSTVALDVDLTKNNPAGLENQSQYAGIGGELSAWGWAQLRAGFRSDLINKGQDLISVGFGLSPRIPYFKPHLDLAVTASRDVLSNGFNNATQAGASLKLGFNF